MKFKVGFIIETPSNVFTENFHAEDIKRILTSRGYKVEIVRVNKID